jgi:hypothetical protein
MTPNLFILGAGKSGTTSLWSMLRAHPEVHMSVPKEPSFFSTQFQIVRDPISYFRLFDSPRRWRGDASHVYMSNPDTAPILRALFPQARFIVILRAPQARAHALYRHMRRFRHADGQPLELLDSFESALTAEEARFADPGFYQTCRHYAWNFLYCRSSFYDEQLSRYFALFPRAQFHILTLAELSRAPVETARALAAFLDIDAGPLESPAHEIRNADPGPRGWSAEAEALMAPRFNGLTARTDSLAGRALDWSL